MNVKALTPMLQKINNKIDNINAGGCGEFALALGRHFTNHNIKFKYVLISYYKGETLLTSTRNFNKLHENIKTNMNDLNNLNYGVSHVMVYHKSYFIDSTGIYDDLSVTKWGGGLFNPSSIISENYLSAWCEDGNWNTMFDRSKISEMKKEIAKIKLN